MNESLRIPKQKVPVTILLPGMEPLKVHLFLAHSARTGRPERPSDLLLGDEAFLPVVDDGGVSFIHRASVCVISVPVEVEHSGDLLEVEDLAADFTTSADIEVVLVGGAKLSGTVSYLLPDGKKRLQDFLNVGAPFMALHDGDEVHLVNKEHVLRVLTK